MSLAPYTNQLNCVLFIGLVTLLNCWTLSSPFHNLNICPCVNLLQINSKSDVTAELCQITLNVTSVKWTSNNTKTPQSNGLLSKHDCKTLQSQFHWWEICQTLNGGKSWTWLRLHQNATTDKMYKLLFCKVLFFFFRYRVRGTLILCLNPLYIDSINSYQVSGMQISVSCTTGKWHQLCSTVWPLFTSHCFSPC